MIAQLSEMHQGDVFAFASELRKHRLRVDIYPESDKQGREEKQRKYASGRQVPFLAFARNDEWARGLVTIRNLHSRKEELVARADAGEFLRRGLEALSQEAVALIPEL
jgi:histidyl-tRNA synthetase